ncbi:MAG: GNAT family N-acetyltransferase [Desulfobacterales bacterium]
MVCRTWRHFQSSTGLTYRLLELRSLLSRVSFSCKPLINIHDVVVLNEFRGNGISLKMLDKVEEIAKSKGCCKITLEVLSNNDVAKSAYRKFGFSSYELDPKAGTAVFWQKLLTH